jgi:hypothetical protein
MLSSPIRRAHTWFVIGPLAFKYFATDELEFTMTALDIVLPVSKVLVAKERELTLSMNLHH